MLNQTFPHTTRSEKTRQMSGHDDLRHDAVRVGNPQDLRSDTGINLAFWRAGQTKPFWIKGHVRDRAWDLVSDDEARARSAWCADETCRSCGIKRFCFRLCLLYRCGRNCRGRHRFRSGSCALDHALAVDNKPWDPSLWTFWSRRRTLWRFADDDSGANTILVRHDAGVPRPDTNGDFGASRAGQCGQEDQ